MIKFFRHIRKSLINQNRFTKYLLYAVGEIILVVIGILIALQLNNLNELSKELKKEHQFLKQIQEDLNQSSKTMKETAEFFFERAEGAAYVCQSFWNPEEVVMDTLIESLVIVFESKREKPLVGTIESLINSGEINLISSDSLRNALIAYSGIVEANLSDIERLDETYYRPAIGNTVHLVNYSEIYHQYGSGGGEYSSSPSKITKTPFPNDYDVLLEQKEIYTNYYQFLIAHRNQALKYNALAKESKKLSQYISKYLENHE